MPLEPENYGQIAHEYSPKIRKRRVFGHVSQTRIGFYGACKSPEKTKTVGNSSLKQP